MPVELVRRRTRPVGTHRTREMSAVGAPAFMRARGVLASCPRAKGYATTGRYSWMSPPSTSCVRPRGRLVLWGRDRGRPRRDRGRDEVAARCSGGCTPAGPLRGDVARAPRSSRSHRRSDDLGPFRAEDLVETGPQHGRQLVELGPDRVIALSGPERNTYRALSWMTCLAVNSARARWSSPGTARAYMPTPKEPGRTAPEP